MIEFYDNDMSVCAQKVRLVLAEKGLEYERHHLNLRAGDQLNPDYLELNPKGVVPTLVHDGDVITESTVIIAYLDGAFPEPPLSPGGALGRARMLDWMIRPDAGLHDACGITSFALAFRMQLAKVDPQALQAFYAKIPEEIRRERIRSLVELGLEAPGVGPALRSYHKTIGAMAKALALGDWLVGEDCSLADITMLPYVLRLDHLGLNWFWDSHPAVAGWLARMQARPSYRAIEERLDPKYLDIMTLVAAREDARLRQIVAERS